MKIGLYGLPTAGKTSILEKIGFMDVLAGSKLLHEIDPDFDRLSDNSKNNVRRELATILRTKDSFIVDGHYAFGDKLAFTTEDGDLYDAFLYLYIEPNILKKRMENSEKNTQYLKYDIEKWQREEMEGLREYCHNHNKDFYILDNPLSNYFEDFTEIIKFIMAIKDGYSCVRYGRECTDAILEADNSETIILADGDKTITIEDSTNMVFGYRTNLFDGNFYTGYQSWKHGNDIKIFKYQPKGSLPVHINENILERLHNHTYILTSGHWDVWAYLSAHLHMEYYFGNQMSADTKYFITKFLQQAGRTVIAYGDGMNDYYMLKQADEGYLVTKPDGSISRSLKNKDLGGIELVRN